MNTSNKLKYVIFFSPNWTLWWDHIYLELDHQLIEGPKYGWSYKDHGGFGYCVLGTLLNRLATLSNLDVFSYKYYQEHWSIWNWSLDIFAWEVIFYNEMFKGISYLHVRGKCWSMVVFDYVNVIKEITSHLTNTCVVWLFSKLLFSHFPFFIFFNGEPFPFFSFFFLNGEPISLVEVS